MHVAGKSLKLNPKVFNEKHGTVLDSGTTYAYFPKQAFNAIKDAVRYLKLSLSTILFTSLHSSLKPRF